MNLFRFIPMLLLTGSAFALSDNPTEAELDAWFNSDEFDLPSPVAHVNEGSLNFLEVAPTKPVHYHQNQLWLDSDSLTSGWVRLRQCHDNLDAVGNLQITFAPGRVEKLKIEETHNIETAWVEGHTIQVRNISRDARLCLSGRSRIVKDTGNGYFTVSNGPYMRRFLDGFYPMRVAMTVHYPDALLEVVSFMPEEQAGFKVKDEPGLLQYDAFFEGRLMTSIQFSRLRVGSR